MRRREFIAACVASTVAARALAADRQRPARIGLIALPARANNPILDGLRQGLAERGYVEGGDVVLEQRYAGGDAAQLPGLIDELLALPVDVLVAQGTPASLAAKRQTTSVPIVILSGDPVGAGLVSSLARPGGNLTGTSILSGDYSVKWLQLLKEAVPRLQRVAVLWNPDNTVIAAEVVGMKQAAPGLALDLVAFPARPKEIDASLAAIAGAEVGGLVLTDDAVIDSLLPRIADFATERRVPTIGGFSNYPSQGGLMSYSVDFIAVGRKSASYVDRILKGARPADLPVEQATDFTLRINLKTAKALGLEIPPNVLARADEVIE
jgi:putative ABC transport system substrate-binding protein